MINLEKRYELLETLALKYLVKQKASKYNHRILWTRVVEDFNAEYPHSTIDREIGQKILFDKTSMEELITLRYPEWTQKSDDSENTVTEKIKNKKDDTKLTIVNNNESKVEFEIKARSVNNRKEEHLEVYSKLSPEAHKTPEYIMETLNYPVSAWNLVDFKESNYGSLENPMFAYSIKVKPKQMEDFNSQDLINVISESLEPIEPLEYEEKASDLTFFLPLTDDHVGHVVFNEEKFKLTIEKARADAIANNVERIVVANLGDFLHVDNTNKTTTAGTQLAVKDDNVYEMWNKGLELMRYMIERLSFVPLKYVWVTGNHSGLVEYGLMNTLKHLYSESEHIDFEVDERAQKAFTIYNTFIGVFHGNMPKKNYTSWGQFEYAKMWGSCNRWEQYSGHFHSKDVFTEGGLQHTILGTQKPTDDWEKKQGYGNHRPIVEAYIYKKDEGKIRAFYY